MLHSRFRHVFSAPAGCGQVSTILAATSGLVGAKVLVRSPLLPASNPDAAESPPLSDRWSFAMST
jgi:hypothetical protein